MPFTSSISPMTCRRLTVTLLLTNFSRKSLHCKANKVRHTGPVLQGHSRLAKACSIDEKANQKAAAVRRFRTLCVSCVPKAVSSNFGERETLKPIHYLFTNSNFICSGMCIKSFEFLGQAVCVRAGASAIGRRNRPIDSLSRVSIKYQFLFNKIISL